MDDPGVGSALVVAVACENGRPFVTANQYEGMNQRMEWFVRYWLIAAGLAASQMSLPAFALPPAVEMTALKACSLARVHSGYFVVEGWVLTSSELRALRIAVPGDPANLFLPPAPSG